MKGRRLDIASEVFMGCPQAPTASWSPRVNEAFATTTRAGNAICAQTDSAAVVVARRQGPQDARRLTASRIAEKRASGVHRYVLRVVPRHRRRGRSFTDAQIISHMIFLMMAAHDTSTSTMTTMAITWPPIRNGRTGCGRSPNASATARWTSRRSGWKRTTW